MKNVLARNSSEQSHWVGDGSGEGVDLLRADTDHNPRVDIHESETGLPHRRRNSTEATLAPACLWENRPIRQQKGHDQ
jgi:hypothetical protein